MLGQVIDKYRIIDILGKGAMGVVYLAQHTVLGRRVAIKLLLPELSNNDDIVRRFFNEAKAATAIEHPGIVEVFDYGYTPDHSAFIVMEYLVGESLHHRLARVGRLQANDALFITRQVARALAAAHRAGIVHRDLKPGNILLTPDPEVPGGERIKILDFGIAKLINMDAGGTQTQTGQILGTPSYMAPEQCRGSRDIDRRADLYALGCILYKMVTGQSPFAGKGPGEILAAHIHSPVPPPQSFAPDLPDPAVAILMRLLEKDPNRRFQSAEELVRTIQSMSGVPQQGHDENTGPIMLPTGSMSALPPISGSQPSPYPISGSQPSPYPMSGSPSSHYPVTGSQPSPYPATGAHPSAYPANAHIIGGHGGPGPGSPTTAMPATKPVETRSNNRLGLIGAVVATGLVVGGIGAAVVLSGGGPAAAVDAGAGAARDAAAAAASPPDAAVAERMRPATEDTCRPVLDHIGGIMRSQVSAASVLYRDLARYLDTPIEADRLRRDCVAHWDQTALECYARAGSDAEVAACGNALAERQCRRGDTAGCVAQGSIALFQGTYDLALQHAIKGCESAVSAGCTLLATMRYLGRGGERDLGAAAEMFERAHAMGDPDAGAALAEMLRYGIGRPADPARARTMLEQICIAKPHHSACVVLGEMEERGEGGRKRSRRSVRKQYEVPCQAGSARGCAILGDVAGDASMYEKAIALYELTAAHIPRSKLGLAELIRDGKGTAADAGRAMAMLEEACGEGEPLACLAAGDTWLSGLMGVDAGKARASYERACQVKVERACAARQCLDQHQQGDAAQAKALIACQSSQLVPKSP